MKKRPIAVIVLSLVLMASGVGGLIQHRNELDFRHLLLNGAVWIALVRMIAIIAGTFMLLGHNWARWLAMGWIGFHLVISIFHPLSQLAVHAVVFAIFAYVLFRPPAAEYFRSRKDRRQGGNG